MASNEIQSVHVSSSEEGQGIQSQIYAPRVNRAEVDSLTQRLRDAGISLRPENAVLQDPNARILNNSVTRSWSGVVNAFSLSEGQGQIVISKRVLSDLNPFPNDEYLSTILKTILTQKQSHDLESSLRRIGINRRKLQEFFLRPELLPFIASALQNADSYRFILGALFSVVQLNQLPELNVVGAQSEPSDSDFSLQPWQPYWNLCNSAESKLEKAIDAGAVMTVKSKEEPYLLIKFNGKLSAVCLRSTVTKEGKMFVEGNWYSLIGNEFRGEVKDAFDAGYGQVDVTAGTFALMRELRSGSGLYKQYIDDLRAAANGIPYKYQTTFLSSKGVERKVYRESHKEEDYGFSHLERTMSEISI